ncbi:MAG: ABC transporter substrate-binding protein [Chloroflexi bacterium]|nr:ABC transporter substrate-binding protein [Chloroflexota bacterium]
MKRLAFLLTPILVLALVLGGLACGDDDDDKAPTQPPTATTQPTDTSTPPPPPPTAAGTIKIGIIGPMEFVQGEHHWYGAQMARDEINAAGGISVAGEMYLIELERADSNELFSTADAVTAMERLITADNADFVMGGIRSEAVLAMQDVAMDYKTIFLGCGASEAELCARVKQDYDRYKYWFRVTPFSGLNLVKNVLFELGIAGAIITQGTGFEGPLKVAVLAEEAAWSEPVVGALNAFVPAKLGMEIVGVWKPSATATDVSTELSAIENSGAHIVVPILSGPVGIPYGKQLGELEIPVASVGINVEAQKVGFWDATGGYGNYMTDLNFYAQGVAVTEKSVAFVDAFIEKFDEIPTYNAGTYEAILLLKGAIERAGTLDTDAVVAELEKTDMIGPGARIVFTGNDTPEPHDITYGPGYATAIATQWQDGEMKCIWPNLGVDEWEGIMYDGTVMWQIPPLLAQRLSSE